MPLHRAFLYGFLFTVTILLILNIFKNQDQKKLEVEMKQVKRSYAESKQNSNALRAEALYWEKVADSANAKLALSLKQLEEAPTIIVYKESLDRCLEAREIDRKRIRIYKGLDVEHEIKEDNFEQIVNISDDYAKKCRGKVKRGFGAGFITGLVVGLIIP